MMHRADPLQLQRDLMVVGEGGVEVKTRAE